MVRIQWIKPDLTDQDEFFAFASGFEVNSVKRSF